MTDWFKAGGHKFCVAENAEEELDEWGLDFMEEEGGDDDHEDGKAADVQNLQRVEDRSDVKSLLLETEKSLEAEITNAVVPETAKDEVAGLVFFTFFYYTFQASFFESTTIAVMATLACLVYIL